MIYSQYNALISNKFAIWVNWKHEIMTIVFAFLAVLLLYLCTLLLHLRIKKGKLQWEENGFWTKSKGEMEKCRRRIMGLWIGRKKGKILVLWHGDCMHEARSIRAVFMRLWDSHPQSMSTACSASPDGCLHYSLAPCAWASLDYTVERIDTKVLHTLEREPAIVEPRSNLTPCILQRAVLSNLEGHEAWRNHFSIPTSLGLMLTVEAWCAHSSFFSRGILGESIFSNTPWCLQQWHVRRMLFAARRLFPFRSWISFKQQQKSSDPSSALNPSSAQTLNIDKWSQQSWYVWEDFS